MRTILLFLLIMLTLAIGIVPYADGYLMKQTFMSNVEQWQALQASQHSDTQIEVTAYKMGWLQSTATVTLNMHTKDGQAINMPINFVIKHGPVVLINNQPTTALAYIQGEVLLPANISALIPQAKNLSLKITSLVPLDRNLTTIDYTVPAFSMGSELTWGGLTGQSIITKSGNVISGVKTTAVIGKISAKITDSMMGMPLTYTMDPITNELTYTRENDKDVSSAFSLKSGKFNVNLNGTQYFNMRALTITSNARVKADMLSTQFTLQANDTQLNPELASPALAAIQTLEYSFALSNLDQKNMNKITEALKQTNLRHDYSELEKSILTIFTNKSTVNTSFKLVTGSGEATTALQLSFLGTPSSKDDLKKMLDGKLEAKISKPLFNELLTIYTSIMALPTMMSPSQEPEMALRNDNLNYFQGIANLVKENAITPEQSVKLMKLPDHVTDKALLEPMVDSFELTPEAKAAVLTLYKKQYMPAEAALPAKETVALPNQDAQIAALIAAGEIKDDGDSYSFTLEKTGQEVKVNGSADSKAAIDLRALLNGEKPPVNNAAAPNEEPTPGEVALATVNANEQAREAFEMINAIAAATDSLAQSSNSYTSSSVTLDNIKTLMPNASLDTPWGSTATFTALSETSYKVELPATPESVCKQLSSRLVANVKFTEVTPATDCKTDGTTFSYVYDQTK